RRGSRFERATQDGLDQPAWPRFAFARVLEGERGRSGRSSQMKELARLLRRALRPGEHRHASNDFVAEYHRHEQVDSIRELRLTALDACLREALELAAPGMFEDRLVTTPTSWSATTADRLGNPFSSSSVLIGSNASWRMNASIFLKLAS